LGLVAVVAVSMPLPQGALEVQAAIATLVGGGTAAAQSASRAIVEGAAPPQGALEVQAAVATLCRGETAHAQSAGAALVEGAAAPDLSAREREERAVAEFIARRYRVAEAASATYVSSAYRSGVEFSLDPLLILAVMAVESSYNPVAESRVGARGLMQIIPRWHPEKLLEHGGEYALLDPEVNIQVGARILREYMARAGEMQAALQMYNGALDEPTARYAGKVLAEKARLRQFLVAALGEG
jgi:soluble lytic murein transglycosylase-like protein